MFKKSQMTSINRTDSSLEEMVIDSQSESKPIKSRESHFSDGSLSSISSVDKSSISGAQTIIIETVDVHQPVPMPRTVKPKPMARKSLLKNPAEIKQVNSKIISEMKTNSETAGGCVSLIQTEGQSQMPGKKMIQNIIAVKPPTEYSDEIESIHDSINSDVELKNISTAFQSTDKLETIKFDNTKGRTKIKNISIAEKDKIEVVKGDKRISDDNQSSESISGSSESEDDENEYNALEIIDETQKIGKTRTIQVAPAAAKHQQNKPKEFEYNYEKIIGVYIHETDKLKFDYRIRTPMIRMSIVNELTGKLLEKSDPHRNVVLNFEPKQVDWIQPIITRSCRFLNTQHIQCQWEELLIINEDIQHILTGNIIIFFEIIDVLAMVAGSRKKDKSGWYCIAWAYFRPGNLVHSNIDRRVMLQLYKYRYRKQSNINKSIFSEWKLKKNKYPSSLSVTIKAMKPIAEKPEVLSRPIHVLHQDKTNIDISDENLSFVEIENKDETISESLSIIQEKLKINCDIDAFVGKFKRLPGHPSQIPKSVLHKIPLERCLVSKFSLNGHFLAVTCCRSTNSFEIDILTVPNAKVIFTLRGHTNTIYDIDFISADSSALFPQYLASASSDRTCIFWTIERSSINLKILPHPAFVYASKILMISESDGFLVTGGRDSVLRIWKIEHEKSQSNLHQELNGHEEYITSIQISRVTNNIFSCDWYGGIYEWNHIDRTSIKYQLLRKIESSVNLFDIKLSPREDKIIVISKNMVKCIDMRTAMPLQTIHLRHFDQQKIKFTMSPCGTYIFTTNNDESRIIAWNLMNGTEHDFVVIPQIGQTKSFISSMDFHGYLDLMSVTIYGRNGGLCLLGHQSMESTNNDLNLIVNSKSIENVKCSENHLQTSKQLNDIIRRVDAIFSDSNTITLNQTDDYKVNEKLIDTINTNDRQVSKSDSNDLQSISNHTFTIDQDTVENFSDQNSISSHRTYNLSKASNNDQNDGTYKIEKHENSDDTTISESL